MSRRPLIDDYATFGDYTPAGVGLKRVTNQRWAVPAPRANGRSWLDRARGASVAAECTGRVAVEPLATVDRSVCGARPAYMGPLGPPQSPGVTP